MPSSESGKPSKPISKSAGAFLTVALFVLGITLYVYSTSLNPGLPILLGGGFAVLVSLWRLVKGSGPYYHWGMDVASALLLWMAVSAPTGLDDYLSQRSLATFVGAVAFLWTTQCALQHSRDWRLFAHAFLALCTVTSLAAWPEAVTIAIKTGHIPPLTGTFVNPDTFSILPLFALMIAPGLLERSGTRLGVAVCVQIGILFITLVATGCRASLLGLGIGAFAFAGTLLSNRSTRHLKQIKMLLAVPLALILFILPLSNFGVQVFEKYSKTFTAAAVAREATRLEVLTHGWQAVLQHPLTGAGPGCFGLAFQSVRGPGHDTLYVNIAHNDPVEVAVELGLLGFVLWAALVFACLHKPFKLLQQGRRPIAGASMMSAVLAITIYSLFNFVISERPVLWAQFWIFGLALSFPSSRLTYQEKPLARYLFSTALVLFGGWAMLFGYRAIQADSLLVQSQTFARTLQIERAIESLEAAIEYQPQRANLRLELNKLEKSWSAFYPGQDNRQRRLNALQAAERSSPVNLGVLLALSDFQTESGDLEAAAATLERAIELMPHRATLRERRAAVAIRQKDLETALLQLLQETSRKSHEEPLAALLIALETESPGKAQSIIRPALEGPDRERLLNILRSATERCWNEQNWSTGQSLALLAAEADPDDLCLRLRWANFVGKAQGQTAEWTALENAMAKTAPSSDSCYGDLLDRWYLLAKQQGQQAKALERLEDDLESDRRIVRARHLLSQALYESGQPTKAINLLREGLDANSRSVLLLTQLAELYEQSGHRDLAINYYREAAEVEPQNQMLKAKLRQLRKGGR